MIKNFAGGDPLQPRVSRIRGSVPIAPHTKPVTPKCASPPTNLKLTSSRKRRNEIRCAPSFRVPPSASDATMPKLPSSFSTKKKTCSCNDVSVQQFVLQVLLCVCQPGARLEKRLIFKSWCVLMSCFCVRLCFIVWGFILCVSGITCDHIRCAAWAGKLIKMLFCSSGRRTDMLGFAVLSP